MKHTLRFERCSVPVTLTWVSGAATYRAYPWPDVRIERLYGVEWVPVAAAPEVLATAARIGAGHWRAFMEFAPADVREFVGCFRRNRLLALSVAARCPAIVGALSETPALVLFVATHAPLRGEAHERWDELAAVYERGGIFAVLEWLGLPAARQTIAILRNVVAPDLPNELLAPMRATLWSPEGVFALARLSTITDRDLAEACHALAA